MEALSSDDYSNASVVGRWSKPMGLDMYGRSLM
jgi:hypothetical protein